MKRNINFFAVLFLLINYNNSFAQTGAALHFDGVNDYVSIPNRDVLNPTKVTIEFWIKWENSAATVNFICAKNYEQLEIHTGGSISNSIRFIPTFNVYLDGPANILPTNVWTHVACIYDPSIALAKLYVNGVEKPFINNGTFPITTPMINSASPFNIGRRASNSLFFKGQLDEFRIWDKVLAPCEIQNTMNCEVSGVQNNLVAYYKFNQGMAGSTNPGLTSLVDSSNNNISGTLTNFALTGSTSNWIAPGAVVPGTACNNPAVSVVMTAGSNPSCAGTTVSFSANTSNMSVTATYQWTKNSTNILGENGSSYSSSELNNNDTIRCLAFNDCGLQAISNGIITKVKPILTPKTIIATNAYTAACTNDTIRFAALAVTGGINPTFQWTKNSLDIPGATDSFFVTTSLTNNDTIRCKTKSNDGCITTPSSISDPEVVQISPVYQFTGNGDWNNPTNWSNGKVPPIYVPPCVQIIIDPLAGGECVLHTSLTVADSSSLKVVAGKKLIINGNLSIGSNSFILDTNTSIKAGLLPDNPDKMQYIPLIDTMDLPSIQSPLRTSTILPIEHTFDTLMPPPGSQQNKDCAAWVVGYGMMSYYSSLLETNFKAPGKPDYSTYDKRVSPTFIYKRARGPILQFIDWGGSLSDALAVINFGYCKWVDMSGEASHNDPIPSNAYSNSFDYVNGGYSYNRMWKIDIDKIKQLLYSNIPVAFGAVLDESFGVKPYSEMKRLSNVSIQSGKVVFIDYHKNAVTRQKHAMLLCGYDDRIQAFKVMNSSGTDWGDNGFVWISYECFKKIAGNLGWGFGKYMPSIFYINVERPSLTITTKPPQSITPSSATSGYTLSNIGSLIYEKGICYSRIKNPTTAWGTNDSTIASTNGDATITGLTTGAIYYVRAYAKTSKGIVYGNEVSFVAQGIGITTTQASYISSTSASSGGNITEDGGAPITARGICYNTSPNPSILNNVIPDAQGGVGTFSSVINGLSNDLKYYIKAYATNSNGTTYGNENTLEKDTFEYVANYRVPGTIVNNTIRLRLHFDNGAITGRGLIANYPLWGIVTGNVNGANMTLNLNYDNGVTPVCNFIQQPPPSCPSCQLQTFPGGSYGIKEDWVITGTTNSDHSTFVAIYNRNYTYRQIVGQDDCSFPIVTSYGGPENGTFTY